MEHCLTSASRATCNLESQNEDLKKSSQANVQKKMVNPEDGNKATTRIMTSIDAAKYFCKI